ncbi:D-2-hydroxyglutarate dehydrogenase, mitochondrial isoform X2 [Camellia sinensis]|uniref:D-2-hydroxyglutarate dehydrogenase, mitochondrial isoform X2 n=1 Tax=Camellia sinensis TaxID=4442 RepID=UPI001036A76E|nr:D-2-hydroxyglutarate dehydrogenase, mitochondrial isoform X2 [Camellia sinensis]
MEKCRATHSLLRHYSRNLFDRSSNPSYQYSNRFPGFTYHFGRTSRLPETFLAHPERNLPPYVNSLREYIGSGLSSAKKIDGHTHRIHCRSFGSVATATQRNPLFSTINDKDITHFKEILGEKNVVQDEERLLDANTDWMRKYKGSSKLLLQPRSNEEVSQILKYCNSRSLAVVPQGGNTGLVGGSVPVFDEVIINMGSMNNIISFDKVSGILVCEAGCILENLVSFLDNQGFIMPLDLGAKGSCQIGGNVSTNAGGLRFVRYGSLHGNVLGLEAVLANGTVLDMLGTLRKDNTGYDLKQLFIGSEGSLGIITKVSILTPPKMSSVNIAFLACKDYFSCQNLLLDAKRKLGEFLSAFEFLDSNSMDLVLDHLEGVRNPLPSSMHNFYVLIETTGSDESYDREKLEAFLLRSMEGGLISDGVLAQDINQALSFWRIREGVPEAIMKAGAVYKYDLSLPVEKMYDLVEEMRIRLGPAVKVVGYGHLGDGNLHLNISLPEYDDTVLAQIEPFVYEWTSKHRGSISAEHGLGLMKANKIHYSKSPESVNLMASIKNLLDPNGILNPYKVLPQSLTA